MRKPLAIELLTDDGKIAWTGTPRELQDANYDDLQVINDVERLAQSWYANRDCDRATLPQFEYIDNRGVHYTMRVA